MSSSLSLILICSILILGCNQSTSSGSIDEAVGKVAPEFTYSSLDGEKISLSQFDNKVVYLFFYGAGCPHCRSNGPVTENQINQRFKTDTNFVAFGLDTWNQSSSANNSFKATTGITYSLLLNAQQSLVDYYGNTTSYDRSVVIDSNGRIAYQGNGYVNTDADEVVNVIQSILDGI
tara:strand:+ start:9297 stop:9824 length:528 start_codon:yes stop_codon:yes gene_type:complete